jgi:hypothetical protein
LILLTPTLSSRRGRFLLNLTALSRKERGLVQRFLNNLKKRAKTIMKDGNYLKIGRSADLLEPSMLALTHRHDYPPPIPHPRKSYLPSTCLFAIPPFIDRADITIS